MNKQQAYDLVYSSDLCSSARQVMCYLILRSNNDGTCFPSIRKISDDTNLSSRTVQRKLRILESEKYIKCDSRLATYGRRTSNLYTITILDTFNGVTPSKDSIELVSMDDILQDGNSLKLFSEQEELGKFESYPDNSTSIELIETSDTNITEKEKIIPLQSNPEYDFFSITFIDDCPEPSVNRLKSSHIALIDIMMRFNLLLIYQSLIKAFYVIADNTNYPVKVYKRDILSPKANLLYKYYEPP